MYTVEYKKEIIEGALKGMVFEVQTKYPTRESADKALAVLSKSPSLGGGWLGPKAQVIVSTLKVGVLSCG
jgi:hypothetical protein